MSVLLRRHSTLNTRYVQLSSLAFEREPESPAEGTSDRDNYVCLIKACGDAKDLAEGRRVHELVRSSYFKNNRFLNNLLVEMYGKCGSVVEARWVFARIEEKNDYSYGIMLKIYVDNNLMHDATRTFMRMPNRNAVAYTSMLTGYALTGALHKAQKLWDRMPDRDVISWNTMMKAYADNKEIVKAKKLFDAIPHRTLVTWNAMVVAYAQNGYLDDAFRVFVTMPTRNVVAWTAMTVAYAQNGRLEEAEFLFKRMPLRDIISWNAMITGYAHNSYVEKAKELFLSMPEQDVISWNAIVNGYAKSGRLLEAKGMFETMPEADTVSWNVMLSAYAQGGQLEEARVLFQMMPNPNTISWNTMISAFAQNEFLDDAKWLFDKMPERTAETWNRMMEGYCDNACRDEAKGMFEVMPKHNVASNTILIQAFAPAGNDYMSYVNKLFDNMLAKDLVAWNSLLGAYARNGRLVSSKSVFERMSMWNEATWTILVCFFKQFGHNEEFIEVLEQSPGEKAEVAWTALLMAYCQSGHLQDAKEAFDRKFQREVSAWVALAVAAYQAHTRTNKQPHGMDDTSKKLVFDRMPQRDVLYWTLKLLLLKRTGSLSSYDDETTTSTAMLVAYAQAGYLPEARAILDSLPRQSSVAWTAIAAAEAQYGSLREAEKLVDAIPERASTLFYLLLLQAYGRLGEVSRAGEIFRGLSEELGWNMMLAGYARNGYSKQAIETARRMQQVGVFPDEISATSILIGCSTKEGWTCFRSIVGGHELALVGENYACMIESVVGDQGGDTGEVIQGMPVLPRCVEWDTLVSACKFYLDVECGVRAAREVAESKAGSKEGYMLLRDMYEAVNKHDEARRLVSEQDRAHQTEKEVQVSDEDMESESEDNLERENDQEQNTY